MLRLSGLWWCPRRDCFEGQSLVHLNKKRVLNGHRCIKCCASIYFKTVYALTKVVQVAVALLMAFHASLAAFSRCQEEMST